MSKEPHLLPSGHIHPEHTEGLDPTQSAAPLLAYGRFYMAAGATDQEQAKANRHRQAESARLTLVSRTPHTCVRPAHPLSPR
jgi:hypothetical protein